MPDIRPHRHLYRKPEIGGVYKFCRGCGKRKKVVTKPKSKTLRNKCDAAWARITKLIHIKKHGPVCLWCKKPSDELQSDHIVNRWKTATRWNIRNCVVLDKVCHLFRKKREPLAWAQMVQENVPAEVLVVLDAAAKELVKPDYELIMRYLMSCEKEALQS